jgi:hypothetical protein
MGRGIRNSQSETHGRVEKNLNGEQKLASDANDSQLYVQAYQTILAKELLINDLNEQDPKYF